MRDATRAGKRVIILDRPDPVGGTAVQGNVRARAGDPDSAFSGFMPVSMRYGMTLGELARLANDALAIGTDLVVVPAAGWNRAMLYDQTGLPWIKPVWSYSIARFHPAAGTTTRSVPIARASLARRASSPRVMPYRIDTGMNPENAESGSPARARTL